MPATRKYIGLCHGAVGCAWIKWSSGPTLSPSCSGALGLQQASVTRVQNAKTESERRCTLHLAHQYPPQFSIRAEWVEAAGEKRKKVKTQSRHLKGIRVSGSVCFLQQGSHSLGKGPKRPQMVLHLPQASFSLFFFPTENWLFFFLLNSLIKM